MSLPLSEHLPLIASASDGIQKLRGLILELAVRGKLVPQDPTDESASTLLTEIKKSRQLLEKSGSCNKLKATNLVSEDKTPFNVPRNWVWTRLGQVTKISTGKLDANAATANGKYPFFTCSRTPSLIDSYSFDTDAVLLAGNGDFNLKKYSGKFNAYQRTYVIEPIRLSLDYLYLFICHSIGEITKNNRGSAVPYLKIGDLTNPAFALPPIAEQLLIVGKVDELMALCDRLESEQNNSAAAHRQLVETLLGTLTQSTDAADFEANWQRIAEHFDTLFTTEASIDALQRTILQLAVMGKLVRQDPSEEAASLLLERIALDRKKLEADGTCKKLKQAPSPAESDQALPLPNGWEWTRLGAMLSKIGAGSTPLGGKQVYVKQGIMFLRSQNVWNDGLHLDDVAFVLPETHKKMSGTHVEPGDILFNITGASIGRCAMVPESFITGNVSQHVTIIRPITKEISRFLHKLLISELIQKAVMDVQVGVSREGLSIGKLAQFLIPMPPLAEQHRIVAKVDELMAVCDQLKASIKTATAAQSTLSSALIQQTLEAA